MMTKPDRLSRRTGDHGIALVLNRFETRTLDCCLSLSEVDGLLWLPWGEAARLSQRCPPDVATETRILQFIEIVDVAGWLLGDNRLVAAWLRTPIAGLGGITPLALFIREADGLTATRNQLRREAAEASRSDTL